MLAVGAARLQESNRIGPLPDLPLTAKVRSMAQPVPVTLDGPLGGGAGTTIRFTAPEFGVAPGQAAVLYAGDRIVGGGWIDNTGLADALTLSKEWLVLPLVVYGFVASVLPVWLLLARELLISGWRSSQGTGGPASWSGKAKTILQFASLLLLLWPGAWTLGMPPAALPQALHGIGWWLFWPSLLLALSSAWGYLRKG